MQNALPFPVGGQSSSAKYLDLLGQKFQSGDTWYRLCKANSTLTASWAVVTAFTAGAPSWVVDTTVIVNDDTVAGFVPAAYTGGVTSANYFLLQISGNVTPLFATTTLVKTLTPNSIGTASTAGLVQVIGTLTAQYDTAAICGFATNTAVVTAVGLAGKAVITGLHGKF